MQFQVQAGAPGKKTSEAPNWRRKGRKGRHAVSSASRGDSREENVRGAKLTENRTRGAPCTLKYKQGLQGRKRQGRQIDGEKDEKGAMQFQVQAGGLQGRKRQGRQIDGEKDERGAMHFKVQAGAPGKKTSGAPNWRRKGREGRHAVSSASRGAPGKKTSGAPIWRRKGRERRHAVSSASRGSREENVGGAKLTEKMTRGAPCSFKCKQRGLQGRKLQGRQIDGEKDEKGAVQFQVQAGGLQGRKRQGRQFDGEKYERGAMQFQVQAGAPGKKTSGAPNWRRKWRGGRHAVSSASRGSREEKVMGAKLTEKRTRDAQCSFKCMQGLQGRKCQGRQIDGEKENKSLNNQTYFPFGLKIRNVVFLNSIIMMLVSFTFLLYSTTPR